MVVSVVADVWFPVAALLTPANTADNTVAPDLLQHVPVEVRFVLGDRHYNTREIRADCALKQTFPVKKQSIFKFVPDALHLDQRECECAA